MKPRIMVRSSHTAQQWIEKVVGEAFSKPTFYESLKDGVMLCKLANKVYPSGNIKAAVSKMPFKQMENINNFLIVMEKLGVPKHDSFQTIGD
jgi:transgelin